MLNLAYNSFIITFAILKMLCGFFDHPLFYDIIHIVLKPHLIILCTYVCQIIAMAHATLSKNMATLGLWCKVLIHKYWKDVFCLKMDIM